MLPVLGIFFFYSLLKSTRHFLQNPTVCSLLYVGNFKSQVMGIKVLHHPKPFKYLLFIAAVTSFNFNKTNKME